MSNRRSVLLAGLGLFALAVFELIAPGVFPIPITDGLLVLFGVGVLGYAYFLVQRRRDEGQRFSETPDVELPRPTTVPGNSVDTALELFPGTEDVSMTSLSSIRSGLRRAAVSVLTRYGGFSETVAREHVQQGTWCDDRAVCEFLADQPQSGAPTPARSVTDSGQRRLLIDRSIDAVVATADVVDPADSTDTEDPVLDDSRQTTVDPAARGIDTEAVAESRLSLGHRRETNHWLGIGFVVFVCLGVGMVTRTPGVLLGAIVGISYAAYAHATPVGAADLTVERSVSDDQPEPGDTVDVSLTVRNEGARFVSDLRLIDGVPESLPVTDGSARRGTTLRRGQSVTLSYTITARRGTHEFGPVLALLRNTSGSAEQELYLSDPVTITCRPSVQPLADPVVLRGQTTQYAGQVETDTGGDGIAFQSVREYHPGDSLTRIDWNRRARTGELTTLQFDEQRAATVVILLDSRPSAYVGPTPTAQTAVDRAVSGAKRVFTRLLADGNRVGLAVVGEGKSWLAPGTGSGQRHEGLEVLDSVPVQQTIDPAEQPLWSHDLGRRLPDRAQLLVFTPLSTPDTLAQLRQFEAHGYPITVISPDPTGAATASQRLARVVRANTITDLRQSAIPVFDWGWEEPLETTLRRETR